MVEPIPQLPLAAEPILTFFDRAELAAPLRHVAQPFGDLARWLITTVPRNPERTVALRKLLEAQDAALRARLVQ